jgi:hemerythrin-like domain-containing protein
MAGRSPAGPLMKEHRVIERMLEVLRRELEDIRSTGTADPVAIDEAADFIRWYADRCHHGKEEEILFARLAEKDIGGELRSMMDDLVEDHVRGRELTRRLVEANRQYKHGDSEALGEIADALEQLAEFYPQHIHKEDRLFFKPCLEQFSAEEKTLMLDDFDEFDRSLIHERYAEQVAELLERTAATPRERS